MLKGKTPLVLALLFGLLAGVIAYSAIKKKEADVRRGWNLVPVVVAGQPISEGSVVTFDMISQRHIPEQFVTSSVVKPENASYILNGKILVDLQPGDPLLWSQFETTKTAERLSTKVQKRTRAVTVSVSKTSSVGGWVRPNDHVDVIGIFRNPANAEVSAATLLQDVIVLATGRITGTTNLNSVPENKRNYSDVSLLVLPEEAEILALAQEMGSLTLTLRNPEDVDGIEEKGRATLKTLFSGERTRALEKRRRQTIQVIRGAPSESGLGAGTP